jgi:hypothetical protein
MPGRPAWGTGPREVLGALGHGTRTMTANLHRHIAPQRRRALADRMQAAFGG